MKKFDLEAARNGEPVRIICFDKKGGRLIVALRETCVCGETKEIAWIYAEDGTGVTQLHMIAGVRYYGYL